MFDLRFLTVFANGLGELALCAVLFGIVTRWNVHPRLRQALTGLSFGAAALLCMSTPSMVAPGVLVDMRGLIVSFSGAFGGPLALGVTAAMTGGYRLWIGGAGVPMAFLAILWCGSAGLLWRRFVLPRVGSRPLAMTILAAANAPHTLLLVFVPVALPPGALFSFLVTVPLVYVLAALTLGAMMQRESDQHERERRLGESALTDPLTLLPNRRAFEGWMATLDLAEERRERSQCYTLALVDLDHFKSVNDRHGHQTGDRVLRSIAPILAGVLRPSDRIARYGGEEFVVFLPGADAATAADIAERMRRRVVRELGGTVENVSVTVSIGIAATSAGARPGRVLASADRALYRAKAEGRNRVALADDDTRQAPLPDEAALRRAS